MWGLAQLSPQADVGLLQEVLQASEGWSEVSTASAFIVSSGCTSGCNHSAHLFCVDNKAMSHTWCVLSLKQMDSLQYSRGAKHNWRLSKLRKTASLHLCLWTALMHHRQFITSAWPYTICYCA